MLDKLKEKPKSDDPGEKQREDERRFEEAATIFHKAVTHVTSSSEDNIGRCTRMIKTQEDARHEAVRIAEEKRKAEEEARETERKAAEAERKGKKVSSTSKDETNKSRVRTNGKCQRCDAAIPDNSSTICGECYQKYYCWD